MFNIWDENIFVQWRLVVFRFYAYKFKVQFFVMSWKDEVIIPLIRMMTYNIYKTLSPKFLAHAVSLYPFVKNSIIFYSIHEVPKNLLFWKPQIKEFIIVKYTNTLINFHIWCTTYNSLSIRWNLFEFVNLKQKCFER